MTGFHLGTNAPPTGIYLPGSTIPRRPSDIWFKDLGWIDGASNPPIFFYTNEDRLAVLMYYCPDDPRITELEHVEAVEMYRDPRWTRGLGSNSESAPQAPGTPSPAPDTEVMNTADSYRVTVTMKWTAIDETIPIPRLGSKPPASKKFQENKSTSVALKTVSRADFIAAFTRAHDQHEKYRIGTTGPPFKFWWTGSGGKANAIAIDKDEEFADAVRSILNKTGAKAAVNVEFDVDGWVPFRLRKRTLGDLAHDNDETDPEELVHGTKVPRVGDYNHQDRMHGHFIELLEARWKCNTHGGENNAPGYCYVDAAGIHIGLNMRKKKTWAAAIAAGQVSVQEPPNHTEFDGARDGRAVTTRPRGRNGPNREVPSTPTPAPAPSTNEPLTLILAALAAKMVNDLGSTPTTPAQAPPAAPVMPSTPKKAKAPQSMPFSPLPTPSSMLHACLADFFLREGIDLTDSEGALGELRFTPAVIPRVALSRLIEVTGAVEGDAILFQAFCEKWLLRQEEKRRAVASPFA